MLKQLQGSRTDATLNRAEDRSVHFVYLSIDGITVCAGTSDNHHRPSKSEWLPLGERFVSCYRHDKNGHRPAPLLTTCRNACRHTGQDARTDINYAAGTKFPGLLPAETWRPPMRGLSPARVATSLTSSVGVAAANELAPTGTLRATFIATDPVQAGTDAISSTADMHCYRRS